MKKKILRTNGFNLALNILAASFFVVLFLRAVTTIDTYWDSLAYHLPFAARLNNIFAKEEFILPSTLEEWYDGFPILAEFFQGLLWKLTGNVAFSNVVAWLSVLSVVIFASVRLKIQFWLLTITLFSIPLVLIHSTISYVDLIGNSLICIGVINLVSAIEQKKFNILYLIGASLPIAVSANVKYNLLPIVFLFLIVIVIIFFWSNRKQEYSLTKNTKSKVLIVVVVLLIFLIAAGNIIKNIFVFQNPIYPAGLKFGPIIIEGTKSADQPFMEMEKWNYLKILLRYFWSLSELPLWTQNNGTLWSVDMSNYINTDSNPFFKMGGYFFVNIVLWLGIVIAAIVEFKSKKGLRYFLLFITIGLFISLIPVSVNLRYYLFFPMLLGIMALTAAKKAWTKVKSILILLIIFQTAIFSFVLYQSWNFVKPNQFSYTQNVISSYELELPDKGICISNASPNAFLFKLANPDLLIQVVKENQDCKYPFYNTIDY